MSSIKDLPDKVERELAIARRDTGVPRFALNNVLDRDEYELLVRNFPFTLLPPEDSHHYAGLELGPETAADNRVPNCWLKVLNVLHSDEFKSNLVRACHIEVRRRYPVIWRLFVARRVSNPDSYLIRTTLSNNYPNRYLPPHSDNSYKALAMVLYLTLNSVESASQGTRFYTANTRKASAKAIRRYNRLSDSRIVRALPKFVLPMTSCNIHNHCDSDELRSESEGWFHSNFTNNYTVPFGPNRIAGFVKTQDSFHEVDLRGLASEEQRLSLLINLNLKHSMLARFGQFVRRRLMGLNS